MQQEKQSVVKALLVEDSPIVLLAHQEIMESLGCQVETAVNGQEAVERLTHKNYDIIFLDMGLPDISGPDVVRLLRQSLNHQQTPIIAITGYARSEDKQAFLAAGVDAIMIKPVSINQVQQALQAYCPHYRPVETAA